MQVIMSKFLKFLAMALPLLAVPATLTMAQDNASDLLNNVKEAAKDAKEAVSTTASNVAEAAAVAVNDVKENATEDNEGLNVVEIISHHISDSHHWNVIAWDGGKKSIDIPLPVMAYNKENGDFVFALSSSFDNEAVVEKNGVEYTLNEHDKLCANGSHDAIFDFSLTRNVASGIMSCVLLLLVFVGAARSIKKSNNIPHGAANAAEYLVTFVKEIGDEQIGKEKGKKFLPFLLTLFFFIWFNNLIGLLPFFPGSTNLSGNIAFTGILAVFTFLVTHFCANKHYWIHTLTCPGVPLLMKVIMVPLEIITMFTRPFTLLIRLFANITGGHIIVISLFTMIFLLQTLGIAPVSVLLGLLVFVLELIFGALQAYIFTVLSALYIGMAVNAGHE